MGPFRFIGMDDWSWDQIRSKITRQNGFGGLFLDLRREAFSNPEYTTLLKKAPFSYLPGLIPSEMRP